MNTQHVVDLSTEKLMAIISMQTEIVKLWPDFSAVIETVCKESQMLIDTDAAVIELIEGDDMVYSATTGIAQSYLGLRLKIKNSLSGLCMSSSEPLYCEDTLTDARVNKAACEQIGARSLIAVPLLHHGEPVGVLKVFSKKPSDFDEIDIKLLSISSELIAAAMFHSARNGMEELYKQAKTDHLTGISNRAHFYDNLRLEISKSKRTNVGFTVTMIDLDNLKIINDRYGHRVGDQALQIQAERLSRTARDTDTVARLGGDEFAIIHPGLIKDSDLKHLLDRLNNSLSEPFQIDGHELNMGASIGTAQYPDENTDMSDLIDIADKKMYLNKTSKK